VNRWSTESSRSAEYWTFQIGDEATDKYRLDVDGYSGDVSDPLQRPYMPGIWHNGMMFTTYDADNDNNADNCAQSYNGGWWFNNCAEVCPTCTGVSFYGCGCLSWPGAIDGAIDDSRMMIKPRLA